MPPKDSAGSKDQADAMLNQLAAQTIFVNTVLRSIARAKEGDMHHVDCIAVVMFTVQLRLPSC